MYKQTVTLYYKDGCHLCEDMLLHLNGLQKSGQFLIDMVDIDSDTHLKERYGTLIPVLEGGGTEICHYYLDEMALRGYLSSTASEVS